MEAEEHLQELVEELPGRSCLHPTTPLCHPWDLTLDVCAARLQDANL